MRNNKLRVGILGATGAVGQRLISLLAGHPWFQIESLMASSRSEGKRIEEACRWLLDSPIPAEFTDTIIKPCSPSSELDFVFSGLDADVAEHIETLFAENGIPVVSNTKTHRMDSDVPLVIPDINPDHLRMIKIQQMRYDGKGFIVTNPNCSTIILSLALAPVHFAFGIQSVLVNTLQAVSGAGYPGVSSNDIIDNVLPYISNEETKMESEPLKIFGRFNNGKIRNADLKISARCHRVMVSDGHLISVSCKLQKHVSSEMIIDAWKSFDPEIGKLGLPSMPLHSVIYSDDPERPQPKKDRYSGKGMTVTIGRLERCEVLEYKFSALGHNTIRGAAGGAILLAELLKSSGYFK